MTSKNDALRRGDIVVIPNREGYWFGTFEFVRVVENCPSFYILKDLANGCETEVRSDLVVRPRLFGDTVADQQTTDTEVRGDTNDTGDGITEAQRKCIFGIAKRFGLDIDDIRYMTPMGSISALTRAQAADIVDRLGGATHSKYTGRAANGTATSKQLGLIEYLSAKVGFSRAQQSAWLNRTFKVKSLDDVADRALASRIIGGLMATQRNRANGPRPQARRETAMT